MQTKFFFVRFQQKFSLLPNDVLYVPKFSKAQIFVDLPMLQLNVIYAVNSRPQKSIAMYSLREKQQLSPSGQERMKPSGPSMDEEAASDSRNLKG